MSRHWRHLISTALFSGYHGRLLVLSQRFDQACVVLRKAFDIYLKQATGFRACGQLLLFCAAYSRMSGIPQTCERSSIDIEKLLVGHNKGVLQKLAGAFFAVKPVECRRLINQSRKYIEPSLHSLFLKVSVQ